MTTRLQDPVEILYLSLLLRWERTAPADGHQGLLDGKPARNTQISRMTYLLSKVAAGDHFHTFNTLARFTGRSDGKSYISRDSSWMIEPAPLGHGWYFEGCTSLRQKQDLLQRLTKVGLSTQFVACIETFVAGQTVKAYMPTEAEQNAILHDIEQREKDHPSH